MNNGNGHHFAAGLPGFDTELADEEELESAPGGLAHTRWIQSTLNQVLGLRLPVDGVMGVQTRSAIRSFQRRQGLAPDGMIGPKTEAALRSAASGSAPVTSGSRPAPTTSGSGTTVPSGPAPCTALRQPAEVLDGFGFDRPEVPAAHRSTIQKIASCLVSSLSIRSVRLVGHTDPVGSPAYNLGLGRRRAEQVARQLRQAMDALQPGSSGRVTVLIETRGESQPVSSDAARNRRVEVSIPTPRPSVSVDRQVDEILEYIRAEARKAATLTRSVSPSSAFARVVRTRYLAGYLASPSPATAKAAIAAISRQNTSGKVSVVCGHPDYWEETTPQFNGVSVPAAVRAIPGLGWLPAKIGSATDILTVAHRRSLSHLDIPFVLGKHTLDLLDCRTRVARGRDPDLQANNSVNESQLMHWATGVRYAHLGRDRLRDLFLAYEMWHLELWDVFGHDPLNDLIAEDAARDMAEHIRGLGMNSANYIATLNSGFRQARLWVGALVRRRRAQLDAQIKADPPPSAFIHWSQEIPPTSPEHPYRAPSIRAMLASGKSIDAVKRSPLVKRYIEVYTLIFEADAWERAHGAIPVTALQRGMADGTLNTVFRALAAAERGQLTLASRAASR